MSSNSTSHLSIASMLCLLMSYYPSATAQPTQYTINGADDALSRNILSHVDIPNVGCNTSVRRLSRFSRGVESKVVRAGRAIGYYQLSANIRFLADAQCWSMVIDVDPGTPVTISSVDVQVLQSEQLFFDLLNSLPVEQGDQLNQARYESIKTNLSSRAIEAGFFGARFERSQLLLDLEENTGAVNIDFEPGLRYQFGMVEIEPIEALSEEFIRRYVSFDDGIFYSSDALIELRNSLSDSQYFSEISVTPDLDRLDDGAVPIQLGLSVKPRRNYSLGAGLTTDVGPRLSASYEDRYRNREGHTLRLGVSTSLVEQAIDLVYQIPWTKPATESLSFVGGFLNEDNDTYVNSTLKLGAVYNFMNRFDWRQSYSLNFQHDEFGVTERDEVTDLLMPGVSLTKTQADDALYPSRGWRLFSQLRGANEDVLSSDSFLQLDLNGKYIFSLGPGRFLTRFSIGTTGADDDLELPPSILYFAGGDQSVRGYGYQSLGPENELGEVVGGANLLTASVEYDFNIMQNWKLAVFADAGNAFSDINDFSIKKSAGLGIRWMSPIGPIRVDVAKALDDKKKIRFHISMGPDL